VSTKQFKYIYNGFDEDELYNLEDDPHEMVNLIGGPPYKYVERDMMRRIWRFARQEQDTMINPYITVGLAHWGPAEAFR
jgi:hypothetical protein